MRVKCNIYRIKMNNGDIFTGTCFDRFEIRAGENISPIEVKQKDGANTFLNPIHISSYNVVGEEEVELEDCE